MKSVSIIMPLFNAARYLLEALQSVAKQTYSDFELICIDDCSIDNTRIILEEFQKKDGRIRILINEEHLGAAPSRNKGLKAAEGKYIMFLDGDDVFEEELLEKVSGAMDEYQTDIVLFEYYPHTPNEMIYCKKVIERPQSFIESFCNKPFTVKDFKPEEFPGWSGSPCNKMYKKSFLEENKLEFQNLPSSNDAYFSKMALLCAKKIIWLDDRRVMVYAREHSEPSRISNDRNPMCAYYALEKLFSESYERNMFAELAVYLYYILQSYLMFVLRHEKEGKRRKDFYNYIQKEGILNCIAYGREYYDEIRIYDKYILDSFLYKPYESEWFYHLDTYFQVYLNKFGKVIINFIREKTQQKKKVFLWGIGKNGIFLLKYLTKNGIKLSGIVDCDENKHGLEIGNYIIQNPEYIYENADYILVASETVYMDIKSIMESRGIILINLIDLLTRGC